MELINGWKSCVECCQSFQWLHRVQTLYISSAAEKGVRTSVSVIDTQANNSFIFYFFFAQYVLRILNLHVECHSLKLIAMKQNFKSARPPAFPGSQTPKLWFSITFGPFR